jgi:hypothetical protein
MGMSTYVTFITPATDPTFIKMKAAYDACVAANVPLPNEVEDYFNHDAPSAKLEVQVEDGVHYHQYSKDTYDHIDVFVGKIPEGVSIIRFTNSY